MQKSSEVIGRICSKYVKPVSMAMDGHKLRGASEGCEGANLKNQSINQSRKIQHQVIFYTKKQQRSR